MSTLALDKSLRSLDADGHMRVAESRISKANVCPYRGSEIPDWQALGLTADRIYLLYRDPQELARAASTFDGKPLLIRHVPVTAEVPQQTLWVGTLGQCTFEAPYLITRPLTIITAEAQALIESEEQRELSAGYRYRAEMIAGKTPEGESYDGVMRDIAGNHVAIVSEGRAGPDVHVADESPLELKFMALKNRKLIARLQKKIPALAGLSAAELMAFDEEIGEVPAKSVVTLDAAEEKAACDAALEEKRKEHGEDAELTEEERKEALEKARDKKAKDAKRAKDSAKDKSEEEHEEEAEDESEEEAEDESDEDEDEPKAKDKMRGKDAMPDQKDHRRDFRSGDRRAKDKRGHDQAMTMDQVNAIVAKAVSRATAATATKVREEVTSQQRALAIAVDEVAPLVGKVQLHAFDSAEEVYAFALEKAGVELEDDFPKAGYRALVKNEVKHRQQPTRRTSHAMDDASRGYDGDALFQRAH